TSAPWYARHPEDARGRSPQVRRFPQPAAQKIRYQTRVNRSMACEGLFVLGLLFIRGGFLLRFHVVVLAQQFRVLVVLIVFLAVFLHGFLEALDGTTEVAAEVAQALGAEDQQYDDQQNQ